MVDPMDEKLVQKWVDESCLLKSVTVTDPVVEKPHEK